MILLVTGGAGFIGSHFIHYYLLHHPQSEVVNLDSLTYAGNLQNLSDVTGDFRYHFVRGDINDQQLVTELVEKYQVDKIVNFAAESHVDRSIQNPQVFARTNVLGVQTLLSVAVQAHLKQFVQISTDEVYGSLGATGQVTETVPLNPSSPYSASKAAADLLVQATTKTYGLHTNITRCCNNFGSNQYFEKLVPLMTIKLLLDQPLPVFGDGSAVRDWLSVADHCRAIDSVLQKGQPGEIYNISAHHERTNLQMINLIAKQLTIAHPKIRHLPDRPAGDQRYALNVDKIQSELGWQAMIPFEKGLQQTVTWYQSHSEWWGNALPQLPYVNLR